MRENDFVLRPTEYSKEQVRTFKDAVQKKLGDSGFDRATIDFGKDFDDETLARFMKLGVLPNKYQKSALAASVVGRVRSALMYVRAQIILGTEQHPTIAGSEGSPVPDREMVHIIADMRSGTHSHAPHQKKKGGLLDRISNIGPRTVGAGGVPVIDVTPDAGGGRPPVFEIEPVPEGERFGEGREKKTAEPSTQEGASSGPENGARSRHEDEQEEDTTESEAFKHRQKLRAALVAAGVRTRPVVEVLGRGRKVMGDALMRRAEKIFAPRAVEQNPVGNERVVSRDDIVREMRKPGAVRPDVINALTSAGWNAERVDAYLVCLYHRNREGDFDKTLFADALAVLKKPTKPKGGSSTNKKKK